MKKIFIALFCFFSLVGCKSDVGCVEGDCENGQGTYTYHHGEIYVGEFKDGYRNGQGTVTYPDGDKYVGEWKKGKSNGQGTLTNADGSIYHSGLWKDNEPVK